MRRNLILIAVGTLAIAVCPVLFAQDSGTPSQSLGDIARQAQKDKANKSASRVFTNDDMPSSPSGGSTTLGAGMGQLSQPASGSKPGSSLTPAEKLAMVETVINKLDAVDRPTLVRNVLGVKSDVQFPGRDRWEEKLFAAKETYVVQGREMIQKARQIIDSAESLKGNQDPNDPRVKEMSARLQSLIHDAVQMDATFQAVMMEGRDLAAQAPAR